MEAGSVAVPLKRRRAAAVSTPAPPRTARSRPTSLLDTCRSFVASRLLVWAIGCGAVVVLGTSGVNLWSFDPNGISTSLGPVGNVLAAPAVRWDAIWYLQIAQHGYRTAQDAGFFPLYPLLIHLGGLITGSDVLSGILISLVAMFVGLELVRRLTELELGPRVAGVTVKLIAFGPLALYLSAVYTEALFLVFTAGTFYAARRGRWWLAGLLGGLASLSRVGGGLLLVPVVLLFLYGPRTDAEPELDGPWWKPRYRFRPALLWAALIPAGAMLFSAYLALRGYGLSGSVHAQEQYWAHRIAFPLTAIWQGAEAAWHEFGLELRGAPIPFIHSDAILQFVALGVAVSALIGMRRRLPFAYCAYVACGLMQALAAPTTGDPLLGMDRYVSMRFPVFMWIAAWAVQRRAERRVLTVSILFLCLFTIQFATWQWVGSPVL